MLLALRVPLTHFCSRHTSYSWPSFYLCFPSLSELLVLLDTTSLAQLPFLSELYMVYLFSFLAFILGQLVRFGYSDMLSNLLLSFY